MANEPHQAVAMPITIRSPPNAYTLLANTIAPAISGTTVRSQASGSGPSIRATGGP